MWEPFLLRALLAGVGLALICGPLGCFIVWRRMAYFGDTLAHSALLGIALGLLLELDLNLGILAACLLIALLLFLMQRRRGLALDTLLGIFSHAALALGLVTLSLMDSVRVDLMGYLFGDILAVTQTDLLWIGLGGGLSLALLIRYWRALVATTVHADLAAAEGVAVEPLRLLLMLMIALVIALAMKIIGVLLITSLLIIPAAAARQFARSPEQMALVAVALGILSVGLGLWSSLQWDLPTGPAIVVSATLIFALSLMRPHARL